MNPMLCYVSSLWLIAILMVSPRAFAEASAVPPDYPIDDFENGNVAAGLRGTAGEGTAPFLYISEKNQELSLTYLQPDGQSDVAWWQGLSYSWYAVDISSYNYFRMDVKGSKGGEDATVEIHYRDWIDQPQKPYVRLSDYGEVSTEMQTINIPLEDFDSLDKYNAFAVALGFRYVSAGVDSMVVDNIGLSVYPSAFFYTHSAKVLASSSAEVLFKPHFPEGEGPCSDVRLVYQVNGGIISTMSMVSVDSVWSGQVTGLADADEVTFHFFYDYPPGSETPEYGYIHSSVIDQERPSAPEGLGAVAISPSQINLTWVESTDNVGVAGYRIYRNDVEIAMTTQTTYSAVALTAGTTYSFYVCAYDASGNRSMIASSLNVTTPVDEQAPTVPLLLTAAVTGPTTVDLSWSASSDDVGVEGYQLFRDGIYYASTYLTHFCAGGIPGTTHAFRILAYDRAMNFSSLGGSVEAIMPEDTAAPSVPLRLAGVASGPRLVSLSWEASLDNAAVVGYEVYRDDVLVETTHTTNCVLFGQVDTTYSFAVRAVDSVGLVSALSETITVTTLPENVMQIGSYASSIPAGHSRPPDTIYMTTNVAPPIPTGDWWSSLLLVRCSGMMSARPLSFYAKGWALDCSYPDARASSQLISAFFNKELEVGATGGSFPAKPYGSSRVDGYGDFSVSTRIGNDESYITANLVHGSPFAYLRFTDCAPVVTCPSGYSVVTSDVATSYLVLRATSAVHSHYALFAPAGTTWELIDSKTITPVLPDGTDFLSVAILSKHGTACDLSEVDLLRQHAYAFVTNTVVHFSYQRSNAMIRAQFDAQIESMQDGQTETLMGVLPHHWKNGSFPTVADLVYETALGDLKIVESNTVEVLHRFGGIVPQFPEPTDATWSRESFEALASEIGGVNQLQTDSYWHGKDLERLARVVPALDSAGLTEQRDRLLGYLRSSLTNLFTYTSEEQHQFFAYNSAWGALHGYNESYNAVSLITDNHFHYGMFVYAAAILGIYDPYFVAAYGDTIDKVVRQYNNPSHDLSGPDPLPWLRCFDPWEGHCWSTGLGGIPRIGLPGEILYSGEKSVASSDGPDQESTSEAMNAWAAMFMWGLVSGNDEFVDMGAAGYAIEASAIREYWYDADESNYPSGYVPTMVCRLFSGKMDPLTWFSTAMDHAWGIQYILTGPHMTYQGYFKEYREQDYLYFNNAFGAENVASGWKDIHWMYRCFFEPEQVLSEYRSSVVVNDGNTSANLYYWIHAMNSLGAVETEIYSDHPSLVAMVSGSSTNYVAFNHTDGPVTARLFRASDDMPLGQVVLHNARTTAWGTDDDDDGDGLKNGEEQTLGTDLFASDSDCDGMTDWQEFFTGSDPVDEHSAFRFAMQRAPGDHHVSVLWQGNPERKYRLRAYTSLEDCAHDVNGSNLFYDVTGPGLYEQDVVLPVWSNGVMTLQAY